MRGDFSNAFSYDAYYQYGRTDYSLVHRNDFSTSRLKRSLDVVAVDPTTGQVVPVGTPGSTIVCRAVLDTTDPNCVPFNYFGTPTAEAALYNQVTGVLQGKTSEQIADVNFTGQLGELGMQLRGPTDGIGINAGWEYRKELLQSESGRGVQVGRYGGLRRADAAGQWQLSKSTKYLARFRSRSSSIISSTICRSAGYRKSWYKLSNGRKYDTDTYKLSAEFAPIADIRFRGSYNRASRAPNIQELFNPDFVALLGSIDPCAGHHLTATNLVVSRNSRRLA